MEVVAKIPSESFGNDAIKNKLPDKMQQPITIEDNMTGEYKGYDYWIDENY